MKTLIRLLSVIVRRFPLWIVLGTIVLTMVLGAFVPQIEQAEGQEGFAPDSPEFEALGIISDEFSEESLVQVVFEADGGDLLTVAGLRSYVAAQEAIAASDAAWLLADRPGGNIVGFFSPLLLKLEMEGTPLEALDTDAAVKDALRTAIETSPPEQAGFFSQLVSNDSDLAALDVSIGMMLAFFDPAPLDDPTGQAFVDIQVPMADEVRAVAAGDVSVEPFSIFLLFGSADDFQREVGILFLLAIIIILVILAFVYWIHPRGRLTRAAATRRTAADVLLTLVAIVMAITWMQGLAVLLGPKYLGWIGPSNEILQIIPILVVGLGVDYAIHMTARYREELGAGASVGGAAAKATTTVGVALVLATITTAVGFLTNVINPVPALKDFGILSAVGIGAAFGIMLTFVPAFRILLDRRAQKDQRIPREAFGHQGERLLPKLMGATSALAERIPVWTLVVTLVLGLVGAFGATKLDTKFSFTDFLSKNSELYPTVQTLSNDFGGGFGTTNVVIEGDVATPEIHNALVASWARMSNTPNVAQSGDRAAASSPVSVVAQLAVPPEFGGDPAIYDADFSQFAFGAGGLEADLTVAAGSDVPALYRRAAEATDAMDRVIAAGPDGAYRYVNVVISTRTQDTGAARELADELEIDFEPMAAAGLVAVPTSQDIVSAVVVKSLQDSQVQSLGLTLFAAMVLLIITFWVESRRPFLGVITIAPVLLIVLWVFGMMALTGIPFSPITSTMAALAIGIGVPYTIHITHRFQEDRVRYETPEEAIHSTTRHTGGALAGSAFTTAAGFGILMTSSIVPFGQFGAVTVFAILFALVASVFVLPSMLVLWDRWHRRRGTPTFDEDHVGFVIDAGVVTE